MVPGAGFRPLLMATAGTIGLMAANAALAHDAIPLQEIVVEGGTVETDTGFVPTRAETATKTDKLLIETPQAISVVNREEFEQKGAQTINEALRYTAGVQADLRPNDRYDIVPVRGFGAYQNFVQYLDGLRLLRGISFSQPTVDVYDLERIEVLKGPASVLYGQMSPGGFVNLVSKKPTEEPIHEVALTAGSDWYGKAGIDLGGPITDDGSLLYRFVASGRYNESRWDDVESERVSVSPSLTFRPTPGTDLTLLFNYTQDPKSAYPSYLPSLGTAVRNNGYASIPYDFDVGDPDFDSYERRVARAGYEFSQELGNIFTFRQNLRYTHIDSEHLGLTGRSIADTTITRLAAHLDEDVDTFAIDNQLAADFDVGPFQNSLLGGVDYQYVSANRLMGTGAAPTIDYLNPEYGIGIAVPDYATDTDQKTEQLGYYLQDLIEIGRLNIALGGRYDDYSIDTDTTTIANGSSSSSYQQNTAFTGRVGATYLFDSGLAPFASYSTSFEPPSGLGISGGTARVLDPVEGEQYEAGIKYQPEGFDSFLMASVYDLRQENAVSSDRANPGYYLQTGEVHSKGVELEAKLSLDNGWDLTGAYTYIDAEITESAVAAEVGNTPALVPEHTASAWAHYTFQKGALEGLGLGAGVRYQGETYGADDNSFTVDPVTLVDVAADYDLSARTPYDVSLSLSVTNLLDEEYVSSCSSSISCFYGTRRTAYARLKYTW